MSKELTEKEIAEKFAQLRREKISLTYAFCQLKFRFDPEAITQKDLGAFLSDIKTHLLADEAGDGELSLTMLKKCEALAKTDNDAELVRRGYMLAETYASYNRKVYYNAVQKSHRDKGRETKAANLEKRNDAMVAAYSALASERTCLSARQLLRDTYGLTLTQVNNILKNVGIVINKKSQSRF